MRKFLVLMIAVFIGISCGTRKEKEAHYFDNDPNAPQVPQQIVVKECDSCTKCHRPSGEFICPQGYTCRQNSDGTIIVINVVNSDNDVDYPNQTPPTTNPRYPYPKQPKQPTTPQWPYPKEKKTPCPYDPYNPYNGNVESDDYNY